MCSFLGQPSPSHLFEDGNTWHLPDEEELMTPLVTSIVGQMTRGKNGDGSDLPLLVGKGEFSLEEKA